MALTLVFIFIFVFKITSTTAQQICYVCNGVDSSTGQDCNFDDACYGDLCYLSVFTNGSWIAGCSSPTELHLGVSLTVGSCVAGENGETCACNSEFCNNPSSWSSQVSGAVEPSDTDLLTCFECGTVIGQDTGLGETTVNISCDGMRTCTGVACLTRKSVNPRSYCVSSWDGVHDVGCTKKMDEDELCVCKQSMCNYPYDPLDLFPSESTTTVLPDGTIVCSDGRHFGPNEQAVKMGEKLKAIILNNFGALSGTSALQDYNTGIDTHICNYKD